MLSRTLTKTTNKYSAQTRSLPYMPPPPSLPPTPPWRPVGPISALWRLELTPRGRVVRVTMVTRIQTWCPPHPSVLGVWEPRRRRAQDGRPGPHGRLGIFTPKRNTWPPRPKLFLIYSGKYRPRKRMVFCQGGQILTAGEKNDKKRIRFGVGRVLIRRTNGWLVIFVGYCWLLFVFRLQWI